MSSLNKIIFSTNRETAWLRILMLVTLIFLIIVLWRRGKDLLAKPEGFEQNQRFLLKRNGDIYDDFYTNIYDVIHQPETQMEGQVTAIIQQTQPSQGSSLFLEVGSGTGAVIEILERRGYKAVGLDNSQAMVSYAIGHRPSLTFKCGDACDPLLYNQRSFSHILCLYYTIYQFKDKIQFFKNCHGWLRSGGVLVVHLVDKPRFNSTIPSATAVSPMSIASSWLTPLIEPKQMPASQNLATVADFGSFTYNASYDVQPNSPNVVFREKFTDRGSQVVRENEQLLYMEELGDIVNSALYNNFIVQGKMALSSVSGGGDPNQYLYFFEKTN
jgi:SAM-dependent methyltransferase